MSENAETSEEAFRELVKILEGAVKAGADAVGLERDGQDLTIERRRRSVSSLPCPRARNRRHRPSSHESLRRRRPEASRPQRKSKTFWAP